MTSNLARSDNETTPQTIEIRPMAMTIGAEIVGADLSKPLSDRQRDEIYAALVKWKAIFFRGQNLTHDQHVAFAEAFGACTPAHHVHGHQDDRYPQIYSFDRDRRKARYKGEDLVNPWSGWHADVTAALNPPSISILSGEVVPPYGGDTQFADMVLAYNTLSPTLRAFLDTLRCVHRLQGNVATGISKEYLDKIQKYLIVSEHPLIRVHPDSGEKALYISPSFTESIVDMTPTESRTFLEMLKTHAARPEFNVRYRWTTGDIAMWDNRQALHRAPRDIIGSDFPRVMHRITLVGEIPVGVDGRPSTAIEGGPIKAVNSN